MSPAPEAPPGPASSSGPEGGPRLTALAVASFLAFGALLVLFGATSSELITALALDYADLGLLGSMLSLGLGLGITSAGPASDRLSRERLFLGACALVAIASLGLGPSTSYAALLAHTFAIGFGAGFYETVLNALIVEGYGTAAPRRLVFVHAAATAAASATPLALEALRALTPLAWYDAFRLVGITHLGLAGLALAVPMTGPPRRRTAGHAGSQPASEPTTTAAAPGGGDPPRARRGDRAALVAVCVATFAYVGVESAVSLFVVDHTTNVLGLGAARAARAISAFWGGLLVGRLAIGFSPRPIGAGTTATLAAVAAATMGAFGAGWIGTPELAMATVGFFLGGVFPVMIGLAGLAWPASAGLAVGLAGGLGSLGGFVVPWLTGRIANAADLGTALSTLALWLAALVVAAATVRRRLRRPPERSPRPAARAE